MKLNSILLTVSRFIIENIASFLLNIAWFCLPPHEVQTCQKQLNTLRNHIYRFLSQLSMVSLFDSNISNNGINIDMSSSLLQKDWFLNGNILEAIYTPQSHTWDCALACLSMIFNLVHLHQSGEQSLNNNKEFNMNNKYSQSNDFIDLSLPNSNISTTPTTTNTTTINARCGVYSLSRKYDSPLWTVDIFYELQRGLEQRLGLELHEAHPSSSSSTSPSSSSKAAKQCVSEYCTAYAGVRSEHYTRYEWYGRQQSDVDRVRVQEMFELCHVSISFLLHILL